MDLLPNISIPVVTTLTFYSGAGPLDMEQSVTRLIERTVSSVNDVDYVQSSTKEGISQVRINFNWDANTDVGLVDVIQRINRILNQMPTGVSQPSRSGLTSRTSRSAGSLCPETWTSGTCTISRSTVSNRRSNISPASHLLRYWGRIREIHVTLDRDRLQALGLPIPPF